jgi:DNA-binding CsgD family transcriptional regulator
LGQYESAYNALFDRERYVDSLDLQGFVEQSLRFDYKRELDSIQHVQELQNLKSSVERDRLRFRVSILVLSILLILGGLSFVVFRLNKKRQLNAVIAENERLEKERIKKEKELELLRKEEQIVSQEIELGVREFELSNLKRMLQDHLDRSNDPDFNEMKIFLSQIRNSEKKVAHLGSLNNILSMNSSDFLKNLKMKHPNLTDDELRLLSLIRLNLGTDELTLIFNISRASLNTKRYRVRKKLGLSSSDSLDSYILAF